MEATLQDRRRSLRWVPAKVATLAVPSGERSPAPEGRMPSEEEGGSRWGGAEIIHHKIVRATHEQLLKVLRQQEQLAT